ncbi:uncharacterized protein LOC115723225 [Cannabis sativa]|uniref:uncharacterized protein LOC115723225 n=1 Tax=Cannabis sativa TaxID=3483 RepID=UPI0029C9EADA|nr:uncharacterized protein LOC115723225 [Cannabis sativa]
MKSVLIARRLSRFFKSPIFLNSDRFIAPNVQISEALYTSLQWRNNISFCAHSPLFNGTHSEIEQCALSKRTLPRANFSSKASIVEGSPTEAVKELYDQIIQSVAVKRTMSPNAWLWSLIENCKNHDDVKLLFDALENLRRFRMSNLRIPDNFNSNLCREVTKTCARVGALDFGKRALRKHNVHGLTPSIGSAHQLLLYAKENNDAKLMVEIMELLEKNDLPLQPGTADIVFGICYNTDNWSLMTKYSKKFIKAGVKLRQTSFDVLMEFASKIGDVESLRIIEKSRSESMKNHTLSTGFSCAKGCLLEHKPEAAATIIQVLNQDLPEAKKSSIMVELQKLVTEWPVEVIKRQKEETKKELAASLQTDIPAMINALINMGLEASVNMEDLTGKEGIPS